MDLSFLFTFLLLQPLFAPILHTLFRVFMCYFRLLFLLFCSPQASYRQIEKTITSKTQQAETQIVCHQVFAQQKSAETKRRFAKIKRHFSTIKRRFVGTKRRFINTWFSKEYKRIGLQEVKVRLFSYLCRAKGLWLVVDWKRQQPEKLYQNKGK